MVGILDYLAFSGEPITGQGGLFAPMSYAPTGAGASFFDRWSPVPQGIATGQIDPQFQNWNPAYLAGPAQPPVPMPRSQMEMPPAVQPTASPTPPPQLQASAPPQQPMQPVAGPGIGDRLLAGGLGFFNASSPMEAVGNLISGAVTGQRADPRGIALQALQQQQMGLYSALRSRGVSQADALAAVTNPEVAKAIIGQEYPATKYEKVGAGDTLYATGPGGAKAVASGGPEKPPAGFRYIDEKNPTKGLEAIPGGPATHLTSEVAGRVALMDQAQKDFALARKELERPWGAMDRVQAAIGAGDIGKAQRIVRVAIEAALRAMTGAAAPESEVKRYMDMFMPGQTDLPSTAKQKLDLLEGFMRDAKKNITQGRTTAPADPLGIR